MSTSLSRGHAVPEIRASGRRPTPWRALPALVVGAGLVLACCTPAAAFAADPPWKRVSNDEGIVVSVREVPDKPYVEFRGVGVVPANLFQVLAVLDDSSRHCDWQANCKVSRVVKTVDEFERYIYHRIAAPWPVSDRDVVVHATVSADLDKRVVTSHFRATNLAGHPPQSGIVRMPELNGFYKCEWIDENSTRVTYQVIAATGGLLPAWLSNRANRKLPFGTLQGMRKQVKLMAGRYEAFHKRFNPAMGGKIPERYAKTAGPGPAQPTAPAQAPVQAPAP